MSLRHPIDYNDGRGFAKFTKSDGGGWTERDGIRKHFSPPATNHEAGESIKDTDLLIDA